MNSAKTVNKLTDNPALSELVVQPSAFDRVSVRDKQAAHASVALIQKAAKQGDVFTIPNAVIPTFFFCQFLFIEGIRETSFLVGNFCFPPRFLDFLVYDREKFFFLMGAQFNATWNGAQ